jgi:hypothetical protein
MDGRRSLLGSANVQPASIELDLMPLQIAHLGSPQAVSIGDKDHACIAMAMPIALGGFDQLLSIL